MKSVISLVVIFFCSKLLGAQTLKGERETFQFNKTFEDEYGYVQAIRVDNQVFISGIAAKGTMDQAIVKVYDRLRIILDHYGATTRDVIKEVIFTTSLDDLAKAKELRKKYYEGTYPTSTWVQVSRFFSAEAVIEVEFTVVLSNTK
jgi:2-iminobutanoate/2-iminopropanoate deaminase